MLKNLNEFKEKYSWIDNLLIKGEKKKLVKDINIFLKDREFCGDWAELGFPIKDYKDAEELINLLESKISIKPAGVEGLSPDVLKNIMSKVRDINEIGTAYTICTRGDLTGNKKLKVY